jgi:hypothetical protein
MQNGGCKPSACPGTDNSLHHGVVDASRDMATGAALYANRRRLDDCLANRKGSAEYRPTGQSDRSSTAQVRYA